MEFSKLHRYICTHQFPIHHNYRVEVSHFALKVQSMASILLSKHRLMLDHSISIIRVHIRLSYSLLSMLSTDLY